MYTEHIRVAMRKITLNVESQDVSSIIAAGRLENSCQQRLSPRDRTKSCCSSQRSCQGGSLCATGMGSNHRPMSRWQIRNILTYAGSSGGVYCDVVRVLHRLPMVLFAFQSAFNVGSRWFNESRTPMRYILISLYERKVAVQYGNTVNESSPYI
jgi:hypothetical protein